MFASVCLPVAAGHPSNGHARRRQLRISSTPPSERQEAGGQQTHTHTHTMGEEKERERKERERQLSALGSNTTASHYADVNLAARQELQREERESIRQGGRERDREKERERVEKQRRRAEVVGESGPGNVSSLCKVDRKAALREIKRR